jgi:two-component system nitrogen regulation response regulator GlnG
MSRILIVDDEPAICWSLKEGLADHGHDVQTASSIERADRLLSSFVPDLIALDVRLPGQDGLSVIPRYREQWPHAPIIVMTAFGELQTVVDAMSRGAFEYLVKPFELTEFLTVVGRAFSGPHVATTTTTTHVGPNQLIGRGASMQAVFRQIALVSPTDFPVLISGETGTGKELVAEAIHRHSLRRTGPFVCVSLASLNPSVIESELFGHVKGAFTGASEDRAGLFELAQNGTIFLDEIGETPLSIQVKLLRVLESRKLSRVGSGEELSTNVRLIAATNRNLNRMISEGVFREDLLHRLKVFSIELPSLRERCEEVRPLVEYFLERQTIPVNRAISDEFWQAIERRHWYGNVRELRNAVDHAVVMARGGPLAADHLPPELEATRNGHATTGQLDTAISDWVKLALTDSEAVDTSDLYRRFLTDAETILFREVLNRTDQNRSAAAKILGLDRATLRNKLGN